MKRRTGKNKPSSLLSQPRRPVTSKTYLMVAASILGSVVFSSVIFPVQGAGAATMTVTTCDASGNGSLPYEVHNAAAGDTINFSVSCPHASPIVLDSSIDINTNLTISGPGSNGIDVNEGNDLEVFDIEAGVTATISGITIANSFGSEDDVGAGGINNYGTLTLSDSVVTQDLGMSAGGIYNSHDLTVVDSTLSDNSIPGDGDPFGGGAVLNDGGTVSITDSTISKNAPVAAFGGVVNDEGAVTITDSTLSGNEGAVDNEGGSTAVVDSTVSGNNYGGGIVNDGGLTTVTASTLSSNSVHATDVENEAGTVSLAGTIVAKGSSHGDCTGTVTDSGYNLADDDSCGFSGADHSLSGLRADLEPLHNNGGATSTLAPMLDSPALNQIPLGTNGNGDSLCPGADQRGVSRPQSSGCDIGSVELVIPDQHITSANAATATVGDPFSFAVTTTGSPVPSITEKGKLPKKLKFTDEDDGTANLHGTPKTAGTYPLTITATFGKGSTKNVVTQSFTLTVDS